jgi:cob(I)alamin adenosyltransferase
MVRINRVYTRKGDGGQTGLVGGKIVGKDDPRVGCYGTVDELNSVLGLVRAENAAKPAGPERDGFEQALLRIQQRLFDLGSELATPPGAARPGRVAVTAEDVTWLETMMDKLNEKLEPLQSFVLPGGGRLNAALHVARTVCRRAEREAVALSRQEPVGAQAIPFLNRLSDALFVFARWAAVSMGEAETLWLPGQQGELNWP